MILSYEIKNIVKTFKLGDKAPQWGVGSLFKNGEFVRQVAMLYAPDLQAWYPAVGVSDKGEPADQRSIILIEDKRQNALALTNLLFGVFVTKGIPREDLSTWIKAHTGQYIIHWTVTGMGGSKLEPGVKPYMKHFEEIDEYIQENGVNRDHCVLRVDPIYPSLEGIELALRVLKEGKHRGFTRFRYSWMDYAGYREWQVPKNLITKIKDGARELGVELKSCAEKEDHEPCLSRSDFKLLGFPEEWFLEPLPYDYASKKASPYPWRYQERPTCTCGANKVDFIVTADYKPCKHQCAYCYLRGYAKNEGATFFEKWTPEIIKKELLRLTKKARQLIQFYMGKKELAPNNWLSNMYESPITINGVTFKCAESAFQALKFSEDEKTFKSFAKLDGVTAYNQGHKLLLDRKENGGVGVKRWEQHRLWVMTQVLKSKFTQDEDLKNKLLATGDDYIEEASPDSFWGSGTDCKGTNMLGKILMLVRDALKDDSKKELNEENCDYLVNTDNNEKIKNIRPGQICVSGRVVYASINGETSDVIECIARLADLKGSMAIPRINNWWNTFPYILRRIAVREDRVVINGVDLSRPSTTGTTGTAEVYYTSYYGARPPIDKSVRISLKPGKGYEAIDAITEFIPDKADVQGYKDHKISAQTYEKHYRAKLDKIPANKLPELLKRCQGKYMLCFEKSSDFCHRHILAAWLREHGYKCEEWHK